MPSGQLNGMEIEQIMSEPLLPFPWLDLVLIVALIAIEIGIWIYESFIMA